MIEIPLEFKDPTRKYKILGLGLLAFGFILICYSIILILMQRLVDFSTVLPGLAGYSFMVLGVFIYMIPSFEMAKYFFHQILKPEGKTIQPVFVLDDYIELYEKFGNLYYLLGDYKRSEIFYGVMVLLKQQQFDPTIVKRELDETDKTIYKIREGVNGYAKKVPKR